MTLLTGRALTPFVKWPGGKRQLLTELVPRAPQQFGRYFEPFVGGGALFFALRPGRALLGDLNPELIDAYRAVRDDVEGVIDALDRHVYDRDAYYRIRAQLPADLSLVERAARFIYLNKSGYNGLYRVNRRGEFNVPFGSYKTPPRFYDGANLRGASALLAGASIELAPYWQNLEGAEAGDFVYLDPPYQPMSPSANFTRYTKEGFGPSDQFRLAELFATLADRGCQLMLSNSYTPLVSHLYEKWNVETVIANRLINSDSTGRQGVAELIVRNY